MRAIDHMLAEPFASGRVFNAAPLAEVEDFLRSRRMETVDCAPASLSIALDGGKYVLRHTAGAGRAYPLRRTFFEKLLKWQDLPAATMDKFDPGVTLDVLNNCLRVIRNDVKVRIENGDALTIVSRRYAELLDVDVLENCRRQGVTTVTRDDFVMRTGSYEKLKSEPVKGDVCGLGFNVCNSETGFMSLRVEAFILRYVCSNGAVVSEGDGADHGMSHYGVRSEELHCYLARRTRSLMNRSSWLKEGLSRAVSTPALPARTIERDLDRLLGFGRGGYFMREFDTDRSRTLYEQFNYVTHRAKRYAPIMRLRIERFAGSMLDTGARQQERHPWRMRQQRWPTQAGTNRFAPGDGHLRHDHPAFEAPEGKGR